jgi:hypothetical protein
MTEFGEMTSSKRSLADWPKCITPDSGVRFKAANTTPRALVRRREAMNLQLEVADIADIVAIPKVCAVNRGSVD